MYTNIDVLSGSFYDFQRILGESSMTLDALYC